MGLFAGLLAVDDGDISGADEVPLLASDRPSVDVGYSLMVESEVVPDVQQLIDVTDVTGVSLYDVFRPVSSSTSK